jgi:hypothetical protein
MESAWLVGRRGDPNPDTPALPKVCARIHCLLVRAKSANISFLILEEFR